MQNGPKYLHIARNLRPGYFGSVALCGRMVNRLALTDEARATCTKCVAESLARSTQAGAR